MPRAIQSSGFRRHALAGGLWRSLKSYDKLTPYQRCASCHDNAGIPLNDPRASLWSHVSNIHRHNVCQQDLEPRNIVMSKLGQLRVVDFGLSDRFHRCIPQDCHELKGLASAIQGTSLNNVSHPGSHTANPTNRHVWLLSAGMSSVMILIYLLQAEYSVNGFHEQLVRTLFSCHPRTITQRIVQ